MQRLPSIPHLRSLYITRIAENGPIVLLDQKELALQVVDIVTLRPEMELCYVALENKCFEIVEGKLADEHPQHQAHASTVPDPTNVGTIPTAAMGEPGTSDLDDESDDLIDVIEEEDEDMDEGEAEEISGTDASHEMDSDQSSDSPTDFSEDDLDSQSSDLGPRVNLRLREILFYDDRVAIFKARHGRL